MLAENTLNKFCKYGKNNKSNNKQDLEREEAKKGPEMSANIAKLTKVIKQGFFFLAKNTHDKYRKNRKNNKINETKIHS